MVDYISVPAKCAILGGQYLGHHHW